MTTKLDYFSLLDVGDDVTQEELETRYQQLADYLASEAIPSHLRDWAHQQAALVDEAYAILADPDSRAAVRQEQRAATNNASSGPTTREAASAERQARLEKGSAREPDPAGSGILAAASSVVSQPLVLAVLLGLFVLGGILLGRYGLPSGGDAGVGSASDSDADTLAIDEERVAQLMAAFEANPNDPNALFDLGETYFQANNWQSAIDWFTQLLGIEPENTHALTDIGTSNFNLGRPEEAKTAWLAVLDIDPEDYQAHYNLGFLYANVEPQDLIAARREWEAVVELAPDSDLARTAQVHLEGLSDAPGENEDANATPP